MWPQIGLQESCLGDISSLEISPDEAPRCSGSDSGQESFLGEMKPRVSVSLGSPAILPGLVKSLVRCRFLAP